MILKNKEKRLAAEKKLQQAVNSKTAEKRMKNDIQNYRQNEIGNVKLMFPRQDVVTEIQIEVEPVDKCHYRNSRIRFTYQVPEDYPFRPPEVKCKSKIFHPNIDKAGNVCLSVLKQGWKATYDLYTVIVGLLHLLQGIRAKDIEDPLDSEAATLMNKDIEQFDKVVQETIRGKGYCNRVFDNIYVEKKK